MQVDAREGPSRDFIDNKDDTSLGIELNFWYSWGCIISWVLYLSDGISRHEGPVYVFSQVLDPTSYNAMF